MTKRIVLSSAVVVFPSNLEPKARHTRTVLVDHRLAVGGGVLCVGEEHALITLGLFVLAHATGL